MTTTLYRIFWISTFLLLTSLLNAQSNYRPGYIITLQKDTVYGKIDYRTDKMNAKRCVFLPNSDDTKPVTYQPFEITGYRFTDDGRYYISRNVELKRGEPKPVFLEYLLQAMKSLYYYEADDNSPIYFVDDNNTLVKIDAPKLSHKPTTGIQFKGETDRYIPLLHYAFKDCPSLSSRIDRAKFTRKDIMSITKKYHYAMCENQTDCIEFEAKGDKQSIQLDVTPYIGVIQYKVPSGSTIGLYSSPDLSYLAGITLAVSSKRWMSSLSGCIDLSFSKISSTARSLNEANQPISIYKHSGTMFSGKLGIRYTYPKGIIRPFVGVGVDISSILNGKKEYNQNSEKWMDGINPGYYINAGVNFKISRKSKQMICLRTQFKGLRDVVEKSSLVNGWSGVIGYTF